LLHRVLSGLPLALFAPAAFAPLPVFLLLLLLMLIIILLAEKKPTLDEVEVMMHVRGYEDDADDVYLIDFEAVRNG
jgi:hypothetical protein